MVVLIDLSFGKDNCIIALRLELLLLIVLRSEVAKTYATVNRRIKYDSEFRRLTPNF